MSFPFVIIIRGIPTLVVEHRPGKWAASPFDPHLKGIFVHKMTVDQFRALSLDVFVISSFNFS